MVSKGQAGQWEILSLRYRPPMSLRGKSALELFQKVWATSENKDVGEDMYGTKHGLGFLFLYDLFQGRQRCKIVGSSYSMWGMQSAEDRQTDSFRFAVLLSQLYTDRKRKGLMTSIINVMSRNKAHVMRFPELKDKRRNRMSQVFNGFTDASEPTSPLANLFSECVPLMKTMRRSKGILNTPKEPPFDERSPRKISVVVRGDRGREWLRPELSDFSKDNYPLEDVTANDLRKIIQGTEYRPKGADKSLVPQPPKDILDSEEFHAFLQKAQSALDTRQNDTKISTGDQTFVPSIVVVDFNATWCGP